MLHFLGIGPTRCGTTWTNYMLRMHPQLWLPKVKELQFWWWLCRRNGGPDISRHPDLFERMVNTYKEVFEGRGSHVCGEISPNYCVLPPDIIEKIREINPGLKSFMIVRDPIDRSFSQMKLQLFYKEGIKPGEFKHLTADRFLEYLGQKEYYNDYEHHYDAWTSVFPPDQLLILDFEDISRRPANFLGKIADHLGVDPFFWDDQLDKLIKIYNQIEAVEMPHEVRFILFNRYKRQAIKIAERFNLNTDLWLSRHKDILALHKENQ